MIPYRGVEGERDESQFLINLVASCSPTAEELCGSGSESGHIVRASPVPPRYAPPQTGKSGSCLCPSQCFPCFPSRSRFPLKGGISSKLGKVKGAETRQLPGGKRWEAWRRTLGMGHGVGVGLPAFLPIPPPHSAQQSCSSSSKDAGAWCVCVCMCVSHTCMVGLGGDSRVEEGGCHASGASMSDASFFPHVCSSHGPCPHALSPALPESKFGPADPRSWQPGGLKQIPSLASPKVGGFRNQ